MERLLALQFGGNWRFTDALSKAQGKAEAGSGGGYSGTRDAEKREASRTELTGANVGGAGSGGGGWWRGDGAVWALDGLLEPVAVRFRFHFEGERQTNRVDSELVGLCTHLTRGQTSFPALETPFLDYTNNRHPFRCFSLLC